MLASSAWLAGPIPAIAADAQGRFAGHGWGVARCSRLVDTLQRPEGGEGRALFVGWIAGYLTAANVHRADTFDLAPVAPPELIANEVAKVCADNPDAAVVEVMVAIVDELAKQRLTSGRPVLDLEHDGNTVRVHREVLRRTQAVLSESDLYTGGVDGAYGPQTRAAITAFQEANGLEPTGLPDQRTLLALFFNVTAPDAAPAPPPAADEAAPDAAAPDAAAPDAAGGDG